MVLTATHRKMGIKKRGSSRSPILFLLLLNSLRIVERDPSRARFQLTPSGSATLAGGGLHNGKRALAGVAAHLVVVGTGAFADVQVVNVHSDKEGNILRRVSGRDIIVLRMDIRRAAHRRLDGLPERVHGQAHVELRPQMLRIAVVAGDAALVALFVADDHAVFQRVKIVLFAQHGEKLHRAVIGALRDLPRGRLVVTDKRRAARVLDASGFTHLHADVGIVAAAVFSGRAVPPAMIPRQELPHVARVAVNHSMTADLPRHVRIVPLLCKHRRAGLIATHAVQHEAAHGDLAARLITCVVGEMRLDYLHAFHPFLLFVNPVLGQHLHHLVGQHLLELAGRKF